MKNKYIEVFSHLFELRFGPVGLEWIENIFDESWKTNQYYHILADDEKVGFCAFENQRDALYINEFGVSKDKQSMGIGTAFLDYLAYCIPNKGRIRLRVVKVNEAAVRFYMNYGFQIAAEDEIGFTLECEVDDELVEQDAMWLAPLKQVHCEC